VTDRDSIFDLLVIGGGINGAGIAADASGRGLKTILCEKSDLAKATSSASTKLIHGGLRYLEYYEFSLVRKALMEREVLLKAAPHIIHPLAFHIPNLPHTRHPLLVRTGLWLYDHLARRVAFKSSRTIRFDPNDSPFKPEISSGFEYWDGQVDDARLVILNAMLAEQHGASILNRTECRGLQEDAGFWVAKLYDRAGDREYEIKARAVVNAAGPWVSRLTERLTGKPSLYATRLVKGSHIVVPKVHEGDEAFMLQHDDGRVIFVIPYLDEYSLIGTTEKEYDDDLDKVEISEEETAYLIKVVNSYLKKQLELTDVVFSYSGVRPLIDEEGKSASSVSRDYRLELEKGFKLPLLSVYGGKVTTYRVLAEDAMDELREFFPTMGKDWTHNATLPGGDFLDRSKLLQKLHEKYVWLGNEMADRLVDSYGTLAFDILADADGVQDLGKRFGHNLYQKEVDYLCQVEWAQSADDILWRRSKLGFQFNQQEREALEQYLDRPSPGASSHNQV